MALISCRECGRACSDQAPHCPNCGYPIGAALSAFGAAHPPPGSFAPQPQHGPFSPGAAHPPPGSFAPQPQLGSFSPVHSSSGRVHGAPPAIPIEPNASTIAFGLALVGLGVFLLFVWIPSHRPMDEVEQLNNLFEHVQRLQIPADHWMFKPWFYPLALLTAGLLTVFGISRVISGATYRAYKQVSCRRCKTMVIAKKGFGGALLCPLGNHSAVGSGLLRVVALALFGFLALMFVVSQYVS
jgi:hypothetical protein